VDHGHRTRAEASQRNRNHMKNAPVRAFPEVTSAVRTGTPFGRLDPLE
jgi:hypothetical protein